MTPPRGYSVRVWAEGVPVAGYRSRRHAATPLQALKDELAELDEVDVAGLAESRYGLVVIVDPLFEVPRNLGEAD